MFSADLSWVDEKSQRVGERREKERLKKVSSTTTTSTRKTTNRTSSTSDETSRIESNILDLPMRRFRAGGLSRRNSMVKIRRESTTSSTNSFPATVVNSNDLPSPAYSHHPRMHFEDPDQIQEQSGRSLIDTIFKKETASHSLSRSSSGNTPIVIKTVSISVESDTNKGEHVKESKRSFWSAPTAWDSCPNAPVSSIDVKSPKQSVRSSVISISGSSSESTNEANPDTNTVIMDHFQRLIMRMENASPQVMLDRLEEDWGTSNDRIMMEELRVEKLLWALTALNSELLSGENLSAKMTDPQSNNIMHFGGSVADIYRSIYKRPQSKVILVSARNEHKIQSTVISALLHRHITFAEPSEMMFPLPIRNDSLSSIFVSSISTLVPGSQIPAFLAESYRLLQPGGQFEARLINALPERSTMGPKLAAWLEDNLMIQLECEFRCSRPCDLMPAWSKMAGFTMADGSRPTLGHQYKLLAASESTCDKASRIGTAVLREIWKDCWSSCLAHNDEQYWWDDEDIIQECLEKATIWKLASLIIVKP